MKVAFYRPHDGQILQVSCHPVPPPRKRGRPWIEVSPESGPGLCLTHKVTARQLAARGEADPAWSDRRPLEPAYKAARRQAYPPLAEQLDALWKGGPEADAMRAKILAVKAAHPKVSP